MSGYDPRAGFAGELRDYLFEALAVVPPGKRRASRWVMNAEWFLEVRRMATSDTRPLWFPSLAVAGPEYLLGLPIEIREDAGAPHLEPAG